jgi:hypothetical protein
MGLVGLSKLSSRRFTDEQERLYSYDSLDAQKQRLKMKRNLSNIVPFNKLSDRDFAYIPSLAEQNKLKRIKQRLMEKKEAVAASRQARNVAE